MMAGLRVAIYEGAGSQPLESAQRFALLRTLLDKGYAVSNLGSTPSVDLGAQSRLMVLGRLKGPAPQLEGAADISVRNIEALAPEEVLQLVDETRNVHGAPEPGRWKPWFPVIDYSRCTNCMQCLSFCLFDVYGASPEGKIQVQNQTNCKTDCPACSRVCPEVAILFPKYRHGPINGDEVHADDLRREAMKVDISALLGGDVYSMLRDRSAKAKSRFSKERDEERALKERQTCLVKLQQEAAIPAEVLASLPSPQEILARAEAARAKAQAALAQAETAQRADKTS